MQVASSRHKLYNYKQCNRVMPHSQSYSLALSLFNFVQYAVNHANNKRWWRQQQQQEIATMLTQRKWVNWLLFSCLVMKQRHEAPKAANFMHSPPAWLLVHLLPLLLLLLHVGKAETERELHELLVLVWVCVCSWHTKTGEGNPGYCVCCGIYKVALLLCLHANEPSHATCLQKLSVFVCLFFVQTQSWALSHILV